MTFQKFYKKALKPISILAWCFFFFSCIPLKIAPNIKEAEIYKGKKFQKHLPKQNIYVFKDPKNADEFYTYINAKYKVNYDDKGENLPILINDTTCYLTFYEIERSTKTINLIPIVTDAVLDSKGQDPMFQDTYISRPGNWYIALAVNDNHFEDLLKENHTSYNDIVKYLDAMRKEYPTTANYMEVYLKQQ